MGEEGRESGDGGRGRTSALIVCNLDFEIRNMSALVSRNMSFAGSFLFSLCFCCFCGWVGVCANKKGLTKNKTPYLRAFSFLGGQFLCKLKPQDGCFMGTWEPKVGAEGVPNFSKAPLHGLYRA